MEIPNPCPMALSQMKEKDGQFFCSGCTQNIIDFRGKSAEEISCYQGKQFCGIFDLEQLPDQKRYTGWNRWLFTGLTFLSLMGLSVKPLQAQTTDPIRVDKPKEQPTAETEVYVHSVSEPIEEVDATRKKWKLFRNRRERAAARNKRKGYTRPRYGPIGCPKF